MDNPAEIFIVHDVPEVSQLKPLARPLALLTFSLMHKHACVCIRMRMCMRTCVRVRVCVRAYLYEYAYRYSTRSMSFRTRCL